MFNALHLLPRSVVPYTTIQSLSQIDKLHKCHYETANKNKDPKILICWCWGLNAGNDGETMCLECGFRFLWLIFVPVTEQKSGICGMMAVFRVWLLSTTFIKCLMLLAHSHYYEIVGPVNDPIKRLSWKRKKMSIRKTEIIF